MGMVLATFLSGCQRGDDLGMGEAFPPALIPEREEEASPQPRKRDNSIQVGDSLELFVNEDDSFDGIYKVREGGDIIIPRVGRIRVAGLSLSGATPVIQRALEKGQLKRATIIVDRVGRAPDRTTNPATGPGGRKPLEEGRQILVYITGKVNRPGQHILTLPDDRPVGVYEAILITGGMSRFGDEQKVYLLRKGPDGKKHRIPVNLRLIEQGEAEDPPIGEGDIVVVPEKVFGF